MPRPIFTNSTFNHRGLRGRAAQALGFKLGELEIRRLREQAQTQLGSHYHVRAFHDEILNGGALPLDVLDERVNGWIAVQNNGETTASAATK